MADRVLMPDWIPRPGLKFDHRVPSSRGTVNLLSRNGIHASPKWPAPRLS